MPPLRPADPSHDPALDAELEEIARRLRAELGARASAAPPPPPRPVLERAHVPATVRFFAAVALPGLVLLGVGLVFGTG